MSNNFKKVSRDYCLTLALILSVVSLAADTASTPTTDRRIEEENRLSLQPTEASIVEDKVPSAFKDHPTINAEYMQRLLKQSRARKVDGVYVVGALLISDQKFTSMEKQHEYLQGQGFIPLKKKGPWNLNEPLTKGELALVLSKVLGIKGGIHMRLFGPSERYALFEMIYQDIMISGSPFDVVSGRELVYTFIRAAEYIGEKNAR